MIHHAHNHDDCVQCLAARVDALEARLDEQDDNEDAEAERDAQEEVINQLRKENDFLRNRVEHQDISIQDERKKRERAEAEKLDLERRHQTHWQILNALGVISINEHTGKPIFSKEARPSCRLCSDGKVEPVCDSCRKQRGDVLY